MEGRLGGRGPPGLGGAHGHGAAVFGSPVVSVHAAQDTGTETLGRRLWPLWGGAGVGFLLGLVPPRSGDMGVSCRSSPRWHVLPVKPERQEQV